MLSKKGAPPQFTWATKPSVTNWPAFSPIIITDVGRSNATLVGSLWHHNGVNWYPVSGSVEIGRGAGSLASPIATFTGAASGKFVLPGGDILVPESLLIPGSSILTYEARLQKVGANATWVVECRLGTTGNSPDARLCNFGGVTGTGDRMHVYNNASIATSISAAGDVYGAPNSDTVGTADISTNLNTALAMYATFLIASASAADVFNLTYYSVSVKV